MKKEQKHLIFIVDDDPTFVEMLHVYLAENETYDIKLFYSAEDCIANLDLEPDVILLDHIFETSGKTSMDGLTALKKIKEQQEDIDVVILTGQDDPKMVFRFVQHGARDYVVKDDDTFDNVTVALEEIFEDDL